jgi:hypothetical protein
MDAAARRFLGLPEIAELAEEHGFDPVTGEFPDPVEAEAAPDGAPDPWKGYDAAHRFVPPGMARTIAEIEALLDPARRVEPRPTPKPKPVEVDEERDARGNRRACRRYMARLYQAERDRSAEDLEHVLAEACADSDVDEDERGRVLSLAGSIRRRTHFGDEPDDDDGDDDGDGDPWGFRP